MASESVIPLVDAFGAERARIIERITGYVQQEASGFDGWYDSGLVRELAETLSARVVIGQVGVARLTDAYLSRATALLTERPVTPVGVDATLSASLRLDQPDLATVYERLGADYRFRVSKGADVAQALNATVTRAGVMADTDLSLAHRAQADRFMRRRDVTRYRRVLRSEKPCGLCAAASDRLYSRSDLMPIHGRCRCGVIPVTVASDPGSQLSDDDLAAIYQAAGGTSAAKLKRVTVQQHGELGPVLTVRGQHFRGPADVALEAA